MSCILIFLDAQRFIDEAVRSVVAQAGWDDWELLLVDDGSTDASTEIARSWARGDRRIRYVEHPGHVNKGMSAARNLGVAKARGRYIAFLDSDDVWLPAMLAQRMRLLEDHPEAHGVIGPTWEWHSWTGAAADRLRDTLLPLPPGLPVRQVVRPPGAFAAVYGQPGYESAPAICSLMMRRETFLGVGGSLATFRSLFEDQVLFARAFLHAPIVLDDRPLALYRQHPSSACAVAIGRGEYNPNYANPALDRFVAWLSAYVEERFGVDGPEWRALVAGRARDEKERARMTRAKWRVVLLRERRRWAWRGRRSLHAVSRLGRRPRRRAFVDAWAEQFVTAWTGRIRGRVLVATSSPRPQWLTLDPRCSTTDVGPLEAGGESNYDWVVVLPDDAARSADALLDACVVRLVPGGSMLALVPSSELPGGAAEEAWSKAARTELVARIRERFPAMVVGDEPFGSGDAAEALRQGITAERAGVVVDHHDGDCSLLIGLSITAR